MFGLGFLLRLDWELRFSFLCEVVSKKTLVFSADISNEWEEKRWNLNTLLQWEGMDLKGKNCKLTTSAGYSCGGIKSGFLSTYTTARLKTELSENPAPPLIVSQSYRLDFSNCNYSPPVCI